MESMVNFLRSALFSVVFYTSNVFLFLFFLPVLMLPYPYFLWYDRLWSRCSVIQAKYILNIDYTVTGQHHIPSGPYLIASLHQSFWDIFILAILFPNPIFVCKKELFWIPVVRTYLKRFQMLGVSRNKGVDAMRYLLSQIPKLQKQKRPLAIFPEGTRSPPHTIQPFQSGVGVLYEKLQYPVIPVVLNSGTFWPRRNFIKTPGTIQVHILPPIRPGLDRSTFMSTLTEQMQIAGHSLYLQKGQPNE